MYLNQASTASPVDLMLDCDMGITVHRSDALDEPKKTRMSGATKCITIVMTKAEKTKPNQKVKRAKLSLEELFRRAAGQYNRIAKHRSL